MENKIKRVTKVQKKIINAILMYGTERYLYNDYDDKEELAKRFNVTVEEVDACLYYVEDKFKFWGVY